jgi:hypothetical protein
MECGKVSECRVSGDRVYYTTHEKNVIGTNLKTIGEFRCCMGHTRSDTMIVEEKKFLPD